MNVRRVAKLAVKQGVVASYVHNPIAPNLGKIGVLVALESAGDPEKLQALGRQLAMHVAAARPEALSVGDVDPTNLDREREVLADQARASGKGEDIIAKMVEGPSAQVLRRSGAAGTGLRRRRRVEGEGGR